MGNGVCVVIISLGCVMWDIAVIKRNGSVGADSMILSKDRNAFIGFTKQTVLIYSSAKYCSI